MVSLEIDCDYVNGIHMLWALKNNTYKLVGEFDNEQEAISCYKQTLDRIACEGSAFLFGEPYTVRD